MRTLRVSLAGAVTLALLAGLSGAAVSQDNEDPPITATHVTGRATSNRDVSQGTWSPVEGVDHVRDAVFEHDIEWSDPRLPSLMRLSENQDWHNLGGGDSVVTFVANIRLEGPEGAWTGPEYGIAHDTMEGVSVKPRMMLLSGEGAYEGLSAMLQRRWEADDPSTRPVLEGHIFEGELPPMPAFPEPPAE